MQKGYDKFLNHKASINSLNKDNRIHSELIVIIAEAGYVTDNQIVAKKILGNFLLSEPQKDQFYCRAKLLMSKIIDYESRGLYGMDSIQKIKYALKYVMEVIEIALLPENLPAYKFLVYNASVVCWHIVHQFLRQSRAKYFLNELQIIIYFKLRSTYTWSCVVVMSFVEISLCQWFPVDAIGTATQLVTKGFPNTRFSFLLQIGQCVDWISL